MRATGMRTLGWTIPAILAAACLSTLPAAHAEPRQGGDTCMSAVDIPGLPFEATGTTLGFNDDYDAACPVPSTGAPDVVYHFVPMWDMLVDLDLCESTFDTKLYVYEFECENAAPIACDDDGCDNLEGRSRLTGVPMMAGAAYYIVIDGTAGAAGEYVLLVQETGGGENGACCHDATGDCFDGVPESECMGPGMRFLLGLTCADFDPPCEPPTEGMTFYQSDFMLDGTAYADTAWGSADLTYVGFPETMYLNLAVNGTWQIENIPVISQQGPGVLHTKTYSFDLGVPDGEVVTWLAYAYTLTPEPLFTMPVNEIDVAVADRMYSIHSGVPGVFIPPLPPAVRLLGHILFGPSHANANFPNQDCGVNECTPAAVSNSLKFLNDTHDLGLDDDDLSIDDMKEATNWEPDGCWIDSGNGHNAWWEDKADHMVQNDMGITTRKITNMADLAAELDADQDIELQGDWHTAAIVGMTPLGNGMFAIDVAHDTEQGTAGGTQVDTIVYDPTTGKFIGSPGFFQGSAFRYAVVECPTPEEPDWWGGDDGRTVTGEYPLGGSTWPPPESGGYPLPGWSDGGSWEKGGDFGYIPGTGWGLSGPGQNGTAKLRMDNSFYPWFVKRVYISFDQKLWAAGITYELRTSEGSTIGNLQTTTVDLGGGWERKIVTFDITPQPAWEEIEWTLFAPEGGENVVAAIRNVKFGTHCEPIDPDNTIGLGWTFAEPWPPIPDFWGLPEWYPGDVWDLGGDNPPQWLEWLAGREGVIGIPAGTTGFGHVNVEVGNRPDPEKIKNIWVRYDYYMESAAEMAFDVWVPPDATFAIVEETHEPLEDGWQRATISGFIIPQPEWEVLNWDMMSFGGPIGIDNVKVATFCETLAPPYPGDMDCDGDVDFDDIDPFVLALGGREAYEAQYPDCNWLNADCDLDGDVDFDDIDAFVALIGTD